MEILSNLADSQLLFNQLTIKHYSHLNLHDESSLFSNKKYRFLSLMNWRAKFEKISSKPKKGWTGYSCLLIPVHDSSQRSNLEDDSKVGSHHLCVLKSIFVRKNFKFLLALYSLLCFLLSCLYSFSKKKKVVHIQFIIINLI